MEGPLRLSFQKGDWIAIAGVAVIGIAVAAFLGVKSAPVEANVIQIFQNSQLVKECAVDAEEIITLQGAYCNIIKISGGRVAIVESDCPGEDCVHSGWIDHAGRSIVCLPNKVEVRIVGSSDDVDFVVR